MEALDQTADKGARAELVERNAGLQRENGPGEQSRQQHNGQRPESDLLELLDDVAKIEGARDAAAHRRDLQTHVLLYLNERGLDPVFEKCQHAVIGPPRGRTGRALDCAAS